MAALVSLLNILSKATDAVSQAWKQQNRGKLFSALDSRLRFFFLTLRLTLSFDFHKVNS